MHHIRGHSCVDPLTPSDADVSYGASGVPTAPLHFPISLSSFDNRCLNRLFHKEAQYVDFSILSFLSFLLDGITFLRRTFPQQPRLSMGSGLCTVSHPVSQPASRDSHGWSNVLPVGVIWQHFSTYAPHTCYILPPRSSYSMRVGYLPGIHMTA